MSTDNRSRSWGVTCPICGRSYVLTNFMSLRWPEYGHDVYFGGGRHIRRGYAYTSSDGIPITDTHLRACDRDRTKAQEARRTR